MEKKPKGKVSGYRAYKLKGRLIEILNGIYETARHFHLTHDEIAKRVKEKILDSEDLARLPAWERGYINGYHECLRKSLYREIMWLLWCDNSLLTRSQVDALTEQEKATGLDKEPGYRTPWARINSDLSRHVWVDSKGEPLRDKPFDAGPEEVAK